MNITSSSSVSPVNYPDNKPTIDSKLEDNKDFEHVCSRLDKNQESMLLHQLSHLADKDKWVPEVANLIKKGDLQNPLLQHPDFDYYALEALKDHHINLEQFATTMFVKSAGVPSTELQTVPLFQDNAPSPVALKILQSNLITRIGKPYIDSTQLNDFFEAMRKLPESEQRFYVIPDHRKPYKSMQEMSISQAVNDNVGFNIFCSLEQTDKPKQRMLPSIGMMQTLLDVKFGKNAMKINPVIGSSNVEDFKNSMLRENKRDMGIAVKGFPLPKKADGFDAPELDFTYHDFYHAAVCSAIPSEVRTIFLEDVASDVQKLQESVPQEQKNLVNTVYEAIVDLEFDDFRDGKGTPQEAFWNNFIKVLEKAVMFETVKQDLTMEKSEEMFSSILKSGISQCFAECAQRNRDKWEKQYHIDFQTLDEMCEKDIKQNESIVKNPNSRLSEAERNDMSERLKNYPSVAIRQRLIEAQA